MSKEYRGKHMDSQDVGHNAAMQLTAIPLRTLADVFLSNCTSLILYSPAAHVGCMRGLVFLQT